MGDDEARGRTVGRGLLSTVKAGGVDLGRKDSLLLDIGCGYGRLAYALHEAGFAGRYLGLEIRADRVEWLKNHFTPAAPSYAFRELGFTNRRLRTAPSGTSEGALEPPLPAPDFLEITGGQLADCVTLFSVFTHMWDDDVAAYLRSIRRVLRHDGVLIFTAFCADEPGEAYRARDCRFSFGHRLNDDLRFEDPANPLAAVAQTSRFFEKILRKEGFKHDLLHGRWRNDGQGVAPLQDLFVARPKDG